LPKSLQKVTIVLGETRGLSASTRGEGFGRVVQSVKRELRRIAKTLVDTPGEQYEEAVVCLQHGIAPEVCLCKLDRLIWRFTATSAAYRRAKKL
jgi:hypothetical protein